MIDKFNGKEYAIPDEDKIIKYLIEGDVYLKGGVMYFKKTLEEIYAEADDNGKKKILKWCKENPEYAKALSVLVGWWDNTELIDNIFDNPELIKKEG